MSGGSAGALATLGGSWIPPRERVRIAWLGAQRSPNTADAYRRDIDQYFAWCDELGVDVLAARRYHVDAWCHALDRRGCQRATVARKLTALASYYRRAVEDEAIVASPVDRVKRPAVDDDSLTSGLDLAEAHHFLGAAEAAGPLKHALIRVLLSTGARVSEVCGASTRDLGVERGHRVLTVTRKGGRRQRLPLPPVCWAVLEGYLAGREGPLFMAARVPMYRQEAYRIVRAVAEGAGIEGKRISPHSLRHTAATLALDAGATLRDVQQMLGHRDPRTTQRYDRARDVLDRSAVHVLAAVLAGEPDG